VIDYLKHIYIVSHSHQIIVRQQKFALVEPSSNCAIINSTNFNKQFRDVIHILQRSTVRTSGIYKNDGVSLAPEYYCSTTLAKGINFFRARHRSKSWPHRDREEQAGTRSIEKWNPTTTYKGKLKQARFQCARICQRWKESRQHTRPPGNLVLVSSAVSGKSARSTNNVPSGDYDTWATKDQGFVDHLWLVPRTKDHLWRDASQLCP
jgi:hypothetical protein